MPVHPEEALPPKILFFSGDEVEYVDHVVIQTKEGPKFKIHMILYDKTLERYGWVQESIKMEEKDYPRNSIVRAYPIDHIIVLTPSPYNQWWFGLCNIDGTMVIDTKLQEMSAKMTRMRSDEKNFMTELHALRTRVRELAEQIREIEHE